MKAEIKSYDQALAYLKASKSYNLKGLSGRRLPESKTWLVEFVYTEPENNPDKPLITTWHNTRAIAVEYKGDRLVSFLQDGRTVIEADENRTKGAKLRINRYSYADVYQRSFEWFFGYDSAPFYDGATFGFKSKFAGCGRCLGKQLVGYETRDPEWPVCDKCAPVLEENHIAITRFA